jgi:hypothetical protein
VARWPGRSADPVPVNGSSRCETVTSRVEEPARTRCPVPIGAPRGRGRGRRRRAGGAVDVVAELVVDAGPDEVVARVALSAVEPRGEPPHAAAPRLTVAPSVRRHGRRPRGRRGDLTTVAQHIQARGGPHPRAQELQRPGEGMASSRWAVRPHRDAQLVAPTF